MIIYRNSITDKIPPVKWLFFHSPYYFALFSFFSSASRLEVRGLNFGFFDQLAVIFEAFMAGFSVFPPLRMVPANQVNDVFFGFDMGNADKIINISVANLASVFHMAAFSLITL